MNAALRNVAVLTVWFKLASPDPSEAPVWSRSLLPGHRVLERRQEPPHGEPARCPHCLSPGRYDTLPPRCEGFAFEDSVFQVDARLGGCVVCLWENEEI
jgi:hypothetical protein